MQDEGLTKAEARGILKKQEDEARDEVEKSGGLDGYARQAKGRPSQVL